MHTNVLIPGGANENTTACMVVDDRDSDLGEAILLKLTSASPALISNTPMLTTQDTDEVMGRSGLRGHRETLW